MTWRAPRAAEKSDFNPFLALVMKPNRNEVRLEELTKP
jgi:hypothetical protein